MARRPWLSLRKNLKGKVQLENKRKKVGWIGGVLFFTKTNKEVPGVQHVPKPGKSAIGLAALGNRKA